MGFLSASEKSLSISSSHQWLQFHAKSLSFLSGLQRSSQASSSAAAFLLGKRCFAGSSGFRGLATVQVMRIP